MKTLRPIAFVLATLLLIPISTVSTWAQDDLTMQPGSSGPISGNLPDSRAGIITLEGLSGTGGLAVGAVPNAGFSYMHDSHYWDRNFYRVDGFIPYNLNPGTDYFYTILSGAMTQGGAGIANLGLGYGYYAEEWDRLFRTTAWLDIDGEPSRTYVALGAQSESLGKYFDTRASFQIVTNDSTDTLFNGLTGNTQFMGNNLFFEGINSTETAFNQADIEVGGPVAWLGDYGINIYGRGYILKNFDSEVDAIGVGIRGEWTITEDITFNANYTHDDLFGSSTYLNIAMTTPDGAPQHVARPVPVNERFSKRPVRTGRIPVLRESETQNVLAINPKTGNAYNFAHVDPNAGPGTGTFTNPFGSINELIAANGPGSIFDVIYVRPATIPGAANDLRIMNGSDLILNDNQSLLGSTVAHMIPVAAGPFGPTVTITPQDPGVPRPVLTKDAIVPGGIVWAADGNTIGGFTFDGEGLHDGIRGDGNSILGDLIDDDVIRMITITNNEFTDTNRGIFLPDLSDGTPMPGMPIGSNISFNTFTNSNVAFDVGINTNNNDPTQIDTEDSETLTMVMIGNSVSGNLEGGTLRSVGPNAFLDLGLRDLNGDAVLDSVFAMNLFDNNGGNGMNLLVETGGNILADIGALPGFVQDIANPTYANMFTNNGGHGLAISGTSSETTPNFVNMRGNLFATNTLSGASIETGGDAVFRINGSQNVYMENIQHGLQITTRNNSSIGLPTMFVEPDFALLDADPTGIIFGNADDPDPMSVVFTSASVFDGEYFIDNGQDGANIQTLNQSWNNIAFLRSNNRNVFAGNGNHGLTIINNSVATVDGNQPIESYYTIRGTEIGNSGQDGIHIELLGAESSLFPEHAVSRYGPNVITIGGQTVNDQVFVVNSGDQGASVTSNHTDTGIFGGGQVISLVGAAFDTFGVYRPDRLYIDQFSAIQNGGDGFEILVQSVSDVNFSMFRSSLIENGGVGLEMDVNTANGTTGFGINQATGVVQPVFLPSTSELPDPLNPILVPRPVGSVFNIGSEIAGTGNLFQSNALQGVFFQTLSPVAETPNDFRFTPNVVVPVFSPEENVSPAIPPQNPHGGLQSGEYASVEQTIYWTFGRLNFYDNIVQTNGTPLNGADGMALQVGTSTNMIASIAGNVFGGNTGADLNIVSVVSQEPDQSVNNIGGNPQVDALAMDPVGVLDLALGLNFASPNPPVSGELYAGTDSNTGAQFTVNTLGITTSLAGRTEVGVFQVADDVADTNKQADRHGFIVINAYGTVPDLDSNSWTQSGSTFTTLQNAIQPQLLFDTFNTGGFGGLDGNGLLRRGFSTVNFVSLVDPGLVFP